MIVRLPELYADKDFRKLSYEKQRELKARLFSEGAKDDPGIVGQRPEVVQGVFERYVNSPPAFEEFNPYDMTDEDRKKADYRMIDDPEDRGGYVKAFRLIERLDQGDPSAIQEASNWMTGNAIANQTLLGQAAMGAMKIGKLLAGESTSIGNIALKRRQLNTLSDYMLSKMSPEQASKAGWAKTGWTTAASITENVALTLLLGGSGAVVKGSQAAGQAAGIVGRPGLFTKGLFGATGAFTRLADAAKTPAATALWTKFAPAATEAAVSGTIDVMRNFQNLLYEGKIEGPKAFWGGLASTFGQGVAWDLGFNLAGDVFRSVFKPFAKVIRGFDRARGVDLEGLEAYVKSGDIEQATGFIQKMFNGKISQTDLDMIINPEVRADLLEKANRASAIFHTSKFDPSTPEGLRVLGKAIADVDVDFDGQAFKLLRDGELLGSSRSAADAIDQLTDIALNRTSFNAELFNLGTKKAPKMAGALGGARGSKIKGLYKIDDSFSKKFLEDPVSAVRQIPVGSSDANLVREQTEGIARIYLKAGGDPYVENTIKLMPQFEGKGEQYFKQVTDWIRSKSPRGSAIPDLAEAYRNGAKSGLSFDGLRVVVEDRLGGHIAQTGSGFTVGLPDPRTGQLAPAFQAESLSDLNAQLSDVLVSRGIITDQEFGEQLYEQTGVMLQRDAASGIIQLRLPTGETLGGPLRSLKEVSDLQPEFRFRLPNEMAPDFFFSGDKIYTSKTIASGPFDHIRHVLDNFTPPTKGMSRELIDEATGATVKTTDSLKMFEVEVPGLGYRRRFTSLGSAKKFVKEQSNAYETLHSLAAERGFRLDATPSGDIVASASDGRNFTFRTKGSLESFLKEAPDPSFSPELADSGLGAQFDEEMIDSIRKRFGDGGDINQWKELYGEDSLDGMVNEMNAYRKKGLQGITREADLTFRHFFGPRYSTLNKLSEVTGDTKLGALIKDFQTTYRMKDAAVYKARELVRKVAYPMGKRLNRIEDMIVSKLLEVPEELWDTTARKWYSKVDVERVKFAARGMRSIYDQLGQEFGIDGMALVKNFNSKIRSLPKVIADMRREGKDVTEASMNDVMSRLFGTGTTESKWASRNLRLDNLMDLGQSQSGIEAISRYIEAGYSEKFQSKILSEMNDYVRTARDPRTKSALQGLLDMAKGGGRGPGESRLQLAALKLTSAISESMQKHVPEFLPESLKIRWNLMARDLTTTDLAGKAQSLYSYAALGWRPARGLFNMMQFSQNALPLFGKTAVDRAIDETDDAFMKAAFDNGLITENVFSATDITEVASKAKRSAMAMQQNAEYLTRGWTAKLVSNQFDESLEKFSAGTIDLPGFVKYTKASILDVPQQKALVEAVQAGNYAAAKRGLQQDMMNLLMGNYSRENYPEAFKGFVGKLFGKFGVYPVNQIDLMRRIIKDSSANPAERALTFIKLIGTGYAIYNGFRAVGIDYNGFKPYDPLTFSGGPGLQIGYDMLQAGKAITNPNDRAAQTSLTRLQQNTLPFIADQKGFRFNVPRLTIPGGLQAQSILQGIENLQEGNEWGAAVNFFGARTYDEFTETGPTWGW